MEVVGIFAGNIENQFLDKELLFQPETMLFYIEGQDTPLTKSIVEALDKQRVIRWTNPQFVEQIFQADIDKIMPFEIEKDVQNIQIMNGARVYEERLRTRTERTVTTDDYDYAIAHPGEKWSEFIVGLYHLRHGDGIAAFSHLRKFYMRYPLEITCIKFLLMSGNAEIPERPVLPCTLPEEFEKMTVSKKYIEDFLDFDLTETPVKISSAKFINFAVSIMATALLLFAFVGAVVSNIPR
jgi:hypothetical protein